MNDEREGLPSASSWSRYELCAGSYQLGLKAREIGQEAHQRGAAAESGERIHSQLAGQKILLADGEQTTAEFLAERALDQKNRIFGDQEVTELREQRLWLNKNLSGKFDVLYYTHQTALVIDYKTGFSEPDPADQNAQMKVLAVLVGVHLPSVEEIIVQIISGPYGVTEARYTIVALSVAYEDIQKTLRAIHAPGAHFAPSVEACRYCPAALICQAVKDLIMPVAKQQYSALPDGGPRAAKLLDEVALLRRHIEEIEAYYKQRMLEDPAYDLPGYSMVPGSIRREVTDWDTARSRLEEYLDLEAIKGAANYRLGDLEKALGKVLKLKGEPLKTRMNEILEGLIVERQNESSLKRKKHGCQNNLCLSA